MRIRNLFNSVFFGIVITLSLCLVSVSWGQEPDWKQLAVQLKSRDAAARRAAIEVIGQRSEEVGVDLLVGALEDPDQEVRSAAALTLGQMGFQKAAPALAKLLKSSQ